MGPDHRGPLRPGPDSPCEGAGQALGGIRGPGHPAHQGLARQPHQEGPAMMAKRAKSPQELQVVPRLLAEPDARIQDDLPECHSASAQSIEALKKKTVDLPHHIPVGRGGLHRGGLSLHVHHHVARPVAGHRAPEGVIPPVGRHIVDEARTGLQRRLRNPRLHRVDRDRHPHPPGQGADHRDHPPELLRLGHRRSPRTGRLPSNIQNIGTLLHQPEGMFHRRLGRGVPAPVKEGIRGYVHHPHQEGRTREPEFMVSCREQHGSAADAPRAPTT